MTFDKDNSKPRNGQHSRLSHGRKSGWQSIRGNRTGRKGMRKPTNTSPKH